MQNEDENPQLTGIAAIDNEIISRCPELKEEPSEIRTELSNQILHFIRQQMLLSKEILQKTNFEVVEFLNNLVLLMHRKDLQGLDDLTLLLKDKKIASRNKLINNLKNRK
ncbi:MAG: hypothetical protein AAFN65_12705 [Bacteroidota bacterium]